MKMTRMNPKIILEIMKMETNRNDLIKVVDIRKNPELLGDMPMVGLCKCWADRKTL